LAAAVITWIVRYVDRGGVFRVRTFQTEEAAVLLISQLRADPAQEFRSWAKVETRDLPLPKDS
jgi:hypothetical protein